MLLGALGPQGPGGPSWKARTGWEADNAIVGVVLPIMGEGILMEPMKELVKHGQAPNWACVRQGIKWSI